MKKKATTIRKLKEKKEAEKKADESATKPDISSSSHSLTACIAITQGAAA